MLFKNKSRFFEKNGAIASLVLVCWKNLASEWVYLILKKTLD